MKTGISTGCLYPMETEQALDKLLSLGFRRFEVALNTVGETEKPFLRELKARLDFYGAEIVSVHPFTSPLETMLLFETYPRRTREGFSFYRRYLEATAFLGGSYLVIHGQRNFGKGVGPLSDEGYWERFGELYRLGGEAGARPAQEIVYNHRSSSPAFLRGMRDYLGEECAFVLDTKQALLSGVTLEEGISAMGGRLAHVHLSDRAGEKACLLPGQGTLDLGAFRRLLEAVEFRGTVVTEVYRESFSEESELEKARMVAKKVFED